MARPGVPFIAPWPHLKMPGGLCTGSPPDLPKLSHLLSVSMKDIGTIQAASRHAPRHNGQQVGHEWNGPPLTIFGVFRV